MPTLFEDIIQNPNAMCGPCGDPAAPTAPLYWEKSVNGGITWVQTALPQIGDPSIQDGDMWRYVCIDGTSDPVVISLDGDPSMTIVKNCDSSEVQSPPQVGDCITYNVTVTNDGDTDLIGLTVDDPLCELSRVDELYTGPVRDSGLPTSSNTASSFHVSPVGNVDIRAEEICATINIGADPDDNFLRFWALQVDFLDAASNNHGTAHMGLQWISNAPNNNAINWGGYDATGVTLLTGPGFLPGGPNTFDYNWTPNTDYKYRVYYVSPGVARAEITNLSTGVVTPIRDLNVGNNATLFSRPTVWGEIFAPCDDLDPICWEWTDFEWTEAGVTTPATTIFTTYQDYANGGCTNTNTSESADGVIQCTNTIRTSGFGTNLDFGGDNSVDIGPGSSADFLCKYFITQADIDAGMVTNTATATVTVGAETLSASSSATCPLSDDMILCDPIVTVPDEYTPPPPECNLISNPSDWSGLIGDTIDIGGECGPCAGTYQMLLDGVWVDMPNPNGQAADIALEGQWRLCCQPGVSYSGAVTIDVNCVSDVPVMGQNTPYTINVNVGDPIPDQLFGCCNSPDFFPQVWNDDDPAATGYNATGANNFPTVATCQWTYTFGTTTRTIDLNGSRWRICCPDGCSDDNTLANTITINIVGCP